MSITIIRKIIYWSLPPLVFFIIFQKIDSTELIRNFKQANLLYVVIGLLGYPLMVFLGAMRWATLVRNNVLNSISSNYVHRQYWIGLVLGVFIPGSIGWDAYRVAAITKKHGYFLRNIGIIFVEKFMALVTCALIVIACYPLLPGIKKSQILETIFDASYITVIIIVAIFVFFLFYKHNIFIRKLIKRLENMLIGSAVVVARKAGYTKFDLKTLSLRDLFGPLTLKKQFPIIMVFSLVIQITGSISSHMFFISLDVDIPFIVNLFVTPVLFFIFLLPISFGSLGVREVAFISIFGVFGVPAEVALLVSFFGLAGLLLNYMISGLVMLLTRQLNR